MRSLRLLAVLAVSLAVSCDSDTTPGDAAGAADLAAPAPPDLAPAPDLTAPPRPCGTRGTGPCASEEYCQFAPGNCGRNDVGGTCTLAPMDCVGESGPPVCGCDDRTYANDCLRAQAGVSLERVGRCDGTCDVDADCPSGMLCCYPCGIPGCPSNRCFAPVNGQCPAFP